MMSFGCISRISKRFQNCWDHSLPQFRQKLQEITSSLDALIIEEGNGMLPAPLLETARSCERGLQGKVRGLELKAREIREKLEDLEGEFPGGLRLIWWWFASLILGQVFGYVGLLVSLYQPGLALLKLELQVEDLNEDLTDLTHAVNELREGISELQQAIDRIRLHVLRLAAMPGSLTFRVERPHDDGSRGRD